ncbi:MAG: OmpH family outer membrane protein [Odoribacter sp.]
MKNTIKLFVLIAFAFSAMAVSAQQKLGHIETQKLIQAMPEMATAQKTLQTKQDEVEKELTNMKEQFQSKLADYSEKSKTYSDVIRNSKEQELQELQQRIQRFQEIALAELEKSQKELMQPVMDKALNAIKEVAKENGFTYIFDMSSGVLLYAAENSQDILPLVKTKLGLQ